MFKLASIESLSDLGLHRFIKYWSWISIELSTFKFNFPSPKFRRNFWNSIQSLSQDANSLRVNLFFKLYDKWDFFKVTEMVLICTAFFTTVNICLKSRDKNIVIQKGLSQGPKRLVTILEISKCPVKAL